MSFYSLSQIHTRDDLFDNAGQAAQARAMIPMRTTPMPIAAMRTWWIAHF
jgi:hypothetical protein